MQKKIEPTQSVSLKDQIVSIRANGRKRVQTVFNEPTLTQQQYKDDCDLQQILERYTRTGELPITKTREGQYMDLANMPSYIEAQNYIRKADELFMSLNAKLRERFHNDPSEFIQFVDDPKNSEELIRLGLATQKQPPADPKNAVPASDPKNKQAPVKETVPAVGEGPKA